MRAELHACAAEAYPSIGSCGKMHNAFHDLGESALVHSCHVPPGAEGDPAQALSTLLKQIAQHFALVLIVPNGYNLHPISSNQGCITAVLCRKYGKRD